MINDLKPYSEYKDTRLPWIGQIPEHWETRRLRHVCDMRVSNVDKHIKPGETPVRLCNYVEVYKNDYIRESTRFMAATASEDERVRFRLQKNDVLITKDSEQWNDIGVPALVECEAPDLVCGYHLAILRSRNGLDGAFLYRVISSYFIAPQFHIEANGVTRYGLSHGAILGVAIPLPPPIEQGAIVRFLNHVNLRIERTIKTKRKVIALLNEQKQVIIHHAVTRGLDPAARLKPSGVLWVDEVPEHWAMTPNRSLFRIRKVLVGSRHKEYQVLSLTKRGVIVRDMDAGGKFSTHWERSQEVRPGDIVFCFFDVDETPRAIGLSPAFGMISPDYTVMECRNPVIASFLECFYVAMDDRKMLRPLYTGLRKRISKPLFLAAKSPIPPTEEIRSILAFIKDAVVGIDSSLNTVTREIALIQEYRTRLISDVVTGKLDVRQAAAQLPDEFEELNAVPTEESDDIEEIESEEA